MLYFRKEEQRRNKMSCYIKELQEENKLLRKALDNFSRRFYCVGHPLNDNILNFNTEQRVYLSRFSDEIKNTLSEVTREN